MKKFILIAVCFFTLLPCFAEIQKVISHWENLTLKIVYEDYYDSAPTDEEAQHLAEAFYKREEHYFSEFDNVKVFLHDYGDYHNESLVVGFLNDFVSISWYGNQEGKRTFFNYYEDVKISEARDLLNRIRGIMEWHLFEAFKTFAVDEYIEYIDKNKEPL